MTPNSCDRELEVMAALGDETLPTALAAHVAGCAACQQAWAIGEPLLRYLAEEQQQPLPDASQMWWRAKLDARREARRRSMQPLDTVERAEPFVAVAVVALAFLLRGDTLLHAITGLLSGGQTSASAQLAVQALVAPVLVGGLVVMALMLLVGLGAAAARD